MDIYLALSVVAFFCLTSIVAFAMALIAWIEVKSLQKSTHSIQYVPATPNFEKVTKDLEEKLDRDIFEAV